MFDQIVNFFVYLFTGKPSAYADLARAHVEVRKKEVAFARAVLIAEEERAVSETDREIRKLKALQERASELETEAKTSRTGELDAFDSETDRRIAALAKRLKDLQTNRAASRTRLNSKFKSEATAAQSELDASKLVLEELVTELAGLVEQKEADLAINESQTSGDE